MWSVHNNYVPDIIACNFTKNGRLNSINYILPHPKTESEKRYPVYAMVNTWNKIPEHIRKISFKNSFTKAYKKYLIENIN